MKVTIQKLVEIEVLYLRAKIGVRYWEDATVNGVVDTDGSLIPLREGDYWCPIINLETGIIQNWEKGKIAKIHYKCCDDGEYWLIADDGSELKYPHDYVPQALDLDGDGYGDYVIMNIDENGEIEDWGNCPYITDFLGEVEDV